MFFSIAQSVKARVDLIKLFAHFCTECKVSEESAFDQVIKTQPTDLRPEAGTQATCLRGRGVYFLRSQFFRQLAMEGRANKRKRVK